jgi:hypothetical protein
LKGLIALQEGMFVVTYRGHAVGIDCKRRLIYDCAFEFAVELSNDGFVKCDILAAQHVRQIIVNDSRRRKLVSGAKDAEFLKALRDELLARFCVVWTIPPLCHEVNCLSLLIQSIRLLSINRNDHHFTRRQCFTLLSFCFADGIVGAAMAKKQQLI